jgi:hypothetical protein
MDYPAGLALAHQRLDALYGIGAADGSPQAQAPQIR